MLRVIFFGRLAPMAAFARTAIVSPRSSSPRAVSSASRPRRTTAPFQYSSSLGLPSAMSRCRDVVLPGGEL